MFDAITGAVISALCGAGINAAAEYPAEPLDTENAIACVSLKSVKLSCSGAGNYIGIYEEEHGFREMYGAKAAVTVCVCIYSPAADCDGLKSEVVRTLSAMDSMSIKAVNVGRTEYDRESSMFRCEICADALLSLVRDLREPETYSLGGET